jgi:pSer/pThr/pTyr-binding forkhead associated (FHA) protein
MNTPPTYLIGREPDPTRPRIVLEDRSVSRTHGSISTLGDGKYVIDDLKSANGTYVREKGGWRRIESANVRAEDEVRLGTYITTVNALLQRAVHTPARIKMERNPETGEIVKKAR